MWNTALNLSPVYNQQTISDPLPRLCRLAVDLCRLRKRAQKAHYYRFLANLLGCPTWTIAAPQKHFLAGENVGPGVVSVKFGTIRPKTASDTMTLR